jgi:hypothetical protein
MEDIFKFIHSTAYFDTHHEKKLKFYDRPNAWDLAEFIKEANLTLGHVGNFSYFYEIDFNKQTFKAWDYTTRWINAPVDWEARGWRCWKGTNGKFGYSTFCKGKKLLDVTFLDIVKLDENKKPVINQTLLNKLIAD